MQEQIKKLIEISKYSNYVMQQIEKRQASAIEGSLAIVKKHGKVNFYLYKDGETSAKYLNHTKMQEIAALAQKRYDKQVYAAIKTRKEAIDKSIEVLKKAEEKFNLDKIYDDFPTELKALITPVQSFDVEYCKEWQAMRLKKSPWPVNTNFRTKKGELVRSKSELIIANKLFDAGIPYHYEVAFYADNQRCFYPDFYVLNPYNKKEYYWEHFGKMGEADYRNDTFEKLEVYAKYGIFQGVNLIATFESAEYSLNTYFLDILIEKFFKQSS